MSTLYCLMNSKIDSLRFANTFSSPAQRPTPKSTPSTQTKEKSLIIPAPKEFTILTFHWLRIFTPLVNNVYWLILNNPGNPSEFRAALISSTFSSTRSISQFMLTYTVLIKWTYIKCNGIVVRDLQIREGDYSGDSLKEDSRENIRNFKCFKWPQNVLIGYLHRGYETGFYLVDYV